MNTPKIVEPVDCKAELIEHLRRQQNEINWYNDNFFKIVEANAPDAWSKLIALCNMAKNDEYYTMSGIILDVIKQIYNVEFQQYLKDNNIKKF
jgi:hypothetical protein